jgi:DNA topoisomerase IB
MDIVVKIADSATRAGSNAAFIYALNALVAELSKTHSLKELDDAVATAIDLCGEHCVTPYVATQVAARHDMSAEHAQVVTAAAQAVIKRATRAGVCERPKT